VLFGFVAVLTIDHSASFRRFCR